MLVKKKPPIWIGLIIWKDIQDRAFLLPEIKKRINQKIDLANYGPGLHSFNFTPIAVLPSNKVHEEEITFHARKKALYIHLKLDYEEVVAAGVDGFLPLVGQLLLEGIDRAPQARVKDFDWVSFRRDVYELLSENGWLSLEEQR